MMGGRWHFGSQPKKFQGHRRCGGGAAAAPQRPRDHWYSVFLLAEFTKN